jgi:hypothetical protein
MGYSIQPVGLIVACVIALVAALWRSVDLYVKQRESAAIIRRDAELKIGITDTAQVLEHDIRRHRTIRVVVRTLLIAILLGIMALYFVGWHPHRWWLA